jgi:glycerol-3-phosphate acyltransferase PlsX
MTPIALDAMGGDRAPAEMVAGAVEATAQGIEAILVGEKATLRRELDLLEADVPIVHAPEVIPMGADPARALRDLPGASISVAARLVKEGTAGALVSAGSTGAALAAAAIIIGRSPAVMRPTIASVFPTPPTPTLVLDSGANPEVKPEHLVQFAMMGSVAAEVFFEITNPRVGLLNNGEEPGKGRSLEKEGHRLLQRAPVNFIGNVEGRDLGSNRVDVIVTDGFVGNIFLKTTEGVAQMVLEMALETIAETEPDLVERVRRALAPVVRRLDYEHTGGAYLLGVNGVVVIAHGSSSRLAVVNALQMAHEGMARDLVERINRRLLDS